MRPVQFRGNNGILKAPEGHPSCSDLPVLTDGNCVISCWELTLEERREVTETGVVWLMVEGASAPPCLVAGKKSDVLVEEEGDNYRIDTSDDAEEHD